MDAPAIQNVNSQEIYKMRFLLLLLPVLLFSDIGVLTKVVDGDTLYFKTNGEKVKCRIEYIDTPESYNSTKLKKDIKNCKDVSAKDMIDAGKSATRAAKRLLNVGNEYLYEVHGKDHYGRSICVVQIDKENTFNEQMVLNGYAVPFYEYMNNTDRTYYSNLLIDAQSSKKGLWDSFYSELKCLNITRGK